MKPSLLGRPLERATRWVFTRIISGLARTARDEDLGVSQLAALYLVDEKGELAQAELAEALLMTPSAASRMVDALVQRDLVQRLEAPTDRRARLLRLTPRAAALLEQLGDARVRFFERITRRLPRAVLKLFLENIERLRSEGGEA